jgi:hypothetical protein
MSTTPGGTGKSQVSPGVIAVAVAVLLLLIVWIAYHNFAPPPHQVIPDNVDTPIARWIRDKAHESGGDISKLSPEDQQKLQSVTQGKGEAYLKKYANAPTQ